MAQKKALGRGLGALIDDGGKETLERTADSVSAIEIRLIETNPYQPRTKFDDESLQELASSIKELGIIQPISVRLLNGNKYQLITGERRLRAAKIAGLNSIPAYIRTADDQGMLEMALVENIQREDLDSIEIAISYQRLIEECKLTQENLSERVGKKRATVTNYLRLLRLPAEIQLGIREKLISMGHARTLITIEDPKLQLDLYKQIVNQELSVRKIEELVRRIGEKKPESVTNSSEQEKITKDYDQLSEQLNSFFNTKIDFKINPKGTGKIIIPFKSNEELERIIGLLDQIKK
ncbi:MAG: ParB/RepB/Spo0J family partition protein [Bacteroidales bacterium]|nr:ParB/RepB/Spo0J family partition protein [Bacteroidales bacterium]